MKGSHKRNHLRPSLIQNVKKIYDIITEIKNIILLETEPGQATGRRRSSSTQRQLERQEEIVR